MAPVQAGDEFLREANFETKRLFLALELPERERIALANVSRTSVSAGGWLDHDLRWVPEANLHLTLRFLGDVTSSQLATLQTQLHAFSLAGPIALLTGEPVFFPHKGPVRVIGVSVTEERDARLELLHRQIEASCEMAELRADGRPFKPHITLARCRDGLPANLRSPWFWHDYPPLECLPRLRFSANEVVLMESVLGGAVPQYHALDRIPLSR